jgi:hypothetical protein
MPGYPGGGNAGLLRSNRQAFLFNNEIVAVGAASIAVQLERISHSSYPFGVSFQAKFSANPGVFGIDIQIADTDLDADYVTVATISASNATFVGRYDLTNLWPRFVRAHVSALGNSVGVTVLVTR